MITLFQKRMHFFYIILFLSAHLSIIGCQVQESSTSLFTPPGSNTIKIDEMITPRLKHTASVLEGGKVLIAGGIDSNHNLIDEAELFDPSTGKFSSTHALNAQRSSHTASILANGKVLIVGGWVTIEGISRSAEIYDPSSGLFANTGNLTEKRNGHAARLLPSGKVLLINGQESIYFSDEGEMFERDFSSAELYDPTTGIFTATGSLSGYRNFSTASLLNNDQVLILGGEGSPNFSSGNLIYDPSTEFFTDEL